MKKLISLFISLIFVVVLGIPAFATSKECSLKEIDLTVYIPEDFITLTRDIKKDDPALEKFNYKTPEQVNDEFEENSVYLNTSPKNGDYGITITAIQTKMSKSIFNLSKYKDKHIQKTIDKAKKKLKKQVKLTDSKIYKNNKITYIVFQGKIEKNGLMYLTQYLTFYNGKQYAFNMYTFNKKPTQQALDIQKEIVNTSKFTKTMKRPFSVLNPTGIPTIDRAIWFLIIAIISISIFFVVRNRKKFKSKPIYTRHSDEL